MKNPRPSVKDIEIAQTENIKRQSIMEESKTRQEVMRKESDAKIESLVSEAVAKGEVAKLKDFNQA